MNARPSWVFFVCKKQQYQGEIALVKEFWWLLWFSAPKYLPNDMQHSIWASTELEV